MSEVNNIRRLSARILRVESLLIALTIGAIAYGDYLVGLDFSLGYLYLVPLSYSALSHRLRTTLLLIAACVALRQWLGPLERSTWTLFARDWVLTAVFLSVVTALYRLGQARRQFFEQARRQRDELVREVELAAKVQRQLLSQNVPPASSIDICARNWPARVVGGDYYDFIPIADDRLGIVIADVSGKGLPAALLMPAVQISLRALTNSASSPQQVLKEFNKTLYEVTDRASFVTLFYAVLNLRTGRLRYANAGHPPGLLMKADGECLQLRAGGVPVGLFPKSDFESGEAELHPTDALILCTDGVIEAQDPSGEDFTMGRLLPLLRSRRHLSSAEIVESIHQAVLQFASPQDMSDDITVIAVKLPPES